MYFTFRKLNPKFHFFPGELFECQSISSYKELFHKKYKLLWMAEDHMLGLYCASSPKKLLSLPFLSSLRSFHEKYGGHHYFLSWRESWTKFEDWDWFNARNYCRWGYLKKWHQNQHACLFKQKTKNPQKIQ